MKITIRRRLLHVSAALAAGAGGLAAAGVVTLRSCHSEQPMVRRSYNYHRSRDDQGLIFCCFQRDLEQGFEAVQHRLRGEAMAKYTLTVGGGHFFVPPADDAWLDALA
ncbi:hypothetical protein ACIF8T_39190 [Streptomyces sp. NPDC085946]|uniref:hypothetical protein n=1 Tax=Streptomyces sp. NPDC085946 TaxID=3365744 RepID=UPI0037D1372D